MTYSEKLKDPRWQKKRLEILNRDNFTCTLCGDETSPLQVHHIFYKPKSDVWEYPNEALVTYCEDCHTVIEYIKKEDTGLTPVVAIKLSGKSKNKTVVGVFKNKFCSRELIIVKIEFGNITLGLSLDEKNLDDIKKLMALSEKLTNG